MSLQESLNQQETDTTPQQRQLNLSRTKSNISKLLLKALCVDAVYFIGLIICAETRFLQDTNLIFDFLVCIIVCSGFISRMGLLLVGHQTKPKTLNIVVLKIYMSISVAQSVLAVITLDGTALYMFLGPIFGVEIKNNVMKGLVALCLLLPTGFVYFMVSQAKKEFLNFLGCFKNLETK